MQAVAVVNTIINSRMNAGNHGLIYKVIILHRSHHAISANAKTRKIQNKLQLDRFSATSKYFSVEYKYIQILKYAISNFPVLFATIYTDRSEQG